MNNNKLEGIKDKKIISVSRKKEEGKYKDEILLTDIFEKEKKDSEDKSKFSKNYKKDKEGKNQNDKNISKYKESYKSMIINSKDRKRIIPEMYVRKIIENENIIFLNGKLYKYEKGYYKVLPYHNTRVMIKDNVEDENRKFLIKYDIDSIYDSLIIDSDIQKSDNDKMDNQWLINCNDGILNLYNKETFDHNPKYYFFNRLNASKNLSYTKSDLKKTHFYKFLNDITGGNKELKKLLQEVTGYIISNFNNAKKFFMIYGISNSGKSVYLDLLEYIIGKENISNIPLQRLSEDKYCVELRNKVANIYSELPDEGIKDLGAIKSLVSPNDQVSARELHKQPISFKNKAKLVFATNTLPELNIKVYNDNTAFYNRVIIVPFLNSIKEEDQDKELIDKLIKEIDIIFCWAIQGLQRYIDNGFLFSRCGLSEEFLNKYKISENYINLFMYEYLKLDENEYLFWEDIKDKFKEFLKENGRNNITFKEYQCLKDILINYFNLEFTKIHRNNQNKWGFRGLTFI